MPMIRLTLHKGALDAETKARLAERLTQVMLVLEGGADTPSTRSIAWVLFDELEPGMIAVGGRFDGAYVAPGGAVLATVTVVEGAMSQTRKSEVHRAVHDILVEALGVQGQKGAGASIWVQIHEVPEGHWGAGGRTVSVVAVADRVGLAPDSDHRRFIDGYFAAKAQAYRAAGYPADTAGLPPGR